MSLPRGSAARTAAMAAPAWPTLRWRQQFPGHEPELSRLRRWLESVLPACPARDDLLLVAVELAANAIAHTASGQGGAFVTDLTWHHATVRITVADGGAAGEPHLVDDPMAEHGRGLHLVRQLSVRMGVAGDARGRLVWADIGWSGPRLSSPSIAAGQAELARHTGFVTWFGHSTLQWWALARRPGMAGLLAAPSASALAELLDRWRA
ncbi:ATP-binding protein [Nonomuraea turkmeniaca]|uniref:ATP-binding protein n=1 Tax=Nonomuraea turkmeniaca TaxID=103838 RepID=A0A5S4EW95_9ACTN|nr:ATP-binding protein [Nonomuraea turkmeniaca]TMR07833.1 ATP-binding protein [Nonomuraea turkmeniaca]